MHMDDKLETNNDNSYLNACMLYTFTIDQSFRFDKMSFKLLCTSFLAILIPIGIKGQCLSALHSLPSYNTRSPINVNTLKVTLANTTTPITLFNEFFDFLTVKNEGNLLEAYANEANDRSFVTGGVLCYKKYKIHKISFFVNQNIFGRSGHTVNGDRAPIEVIAMYYDPKYGSFEEARGKPAGIVQISNPVKVGLIPNPFFVPFEFLLKSGALREPNSSVKFLAPLVYLWFDALSFESPYYAYVGSYVDFSTGKEYPGSINIIPSKPLAFISYFQFLSFRNVLSSKGRPLQAILPNYPQGNRPVTKEFFYFQGTLPL